jgi:hypothetical protein
LRKTRDLKLIDLIKYNIDEIHNIRI